MPRRKFQTGDRVRGRSDCDRAWVRDIRGTVTAYGPSSGEYTLLLDTGETTYVMSSWIELDAFA